MPEPESSNPGRDSWRGQLYLLRRAASCARYVGRLPTLPLEGQFAGVGDVPIEMRHHYRPRGLPHGDAYLLAMITAHTAPKRIFEIGTAHGDTTLLFARHAPGAHIDTLDLGDFQPSFGAQAADPPMADVSTVGEAFRSSPQADSITQHFGDSVTFDYSPFKGKMDLVFVDGAHTYEFASSDSRTALSLVSPGGVIVWDDCHLYHPGVSKALLELRQEGHPIGRVEHSRLAVMTAPA